MKKIYALLLAAGISGQLFAGGIVSNTNQSAQFVRMLSRNASTQIDAVYFNPAGLVRMDDGFHFSLHNQSIFQDKTISTTFPGLNKSEYVGEVQAPLFPSFFAVYKKDKLALSFGFGPNGGGGSAEFNGGLPSFETLLWGTAIMNGASAYRGDVYFNGTSVYWGSQLNASYSFSDMISASVGVRMLNAKNTYEGSIKNHAGYINHPTLGLIWAPMIPDTDISATETGIGFTPIVGLNLSPNEKLNISIKYEFNTKLELTQKDVKDDNGMAFKEDSTYRNDVPAILGIGVGYQISEKLRTQLSFNTYFDKQADRSGLEDSIGSNMIEIGLGLEYDLLDNLSVSAGFLRGITGVNDGYQTDISYSNSSSTIGFGGQYRLNEKLSIDLGFLYTMYDDYVIDYPADAPFPAYSETYDKKTMDIAIGVNYKF